MGDGALAECVQSKRARAVLRHLTTATATANVVVEQAWAAMDEEYDGVDFVDWLRACFKLEVKHWPAATQEPALNPELIPFGFQDNLLSGRWAYEHIRWMRQKDRLGQDMFLVGMHGPMRRWLALVYCARANREVEYLALTQDTTESDLKQRRELVPGGSAEYFDQGTLQAALHGRVLIVEGLEKAERNVMPVLNNLLENREMALEDGRFLLPQARYAELSPAQREHSKLVPVHPDFRVIALGVPVPPFPGNPLDPPLRSRFQGCRVEPAPDEALLEVLDATCSLVSPERRTRLLQFNRSLLAIGAEALVAADSVGGPATALQQLMFCAEPGILSAAQLLHTFPQMTLAEAVSRVYPVEAMYAVRDLGVRAKLDALIASLDEDAGAQYTVTESMDSSNSEHPTITLRFDPPASVTAAGGGAVPKLPLPLDEGSAMQDHHMKLLTGMLQSHAVGKDICLMGERGAGKSFMARHFARATGYAPVETVFIYSDMTARDLLQRRTTGEEKETLWQPTPLTTAATEGRLCVLDGIQRLPTGAISALLRLIEDRELTLFDGTRFVRPERYARMQTELGLSEAQLTERHIFPVHPGFRILALATPPTGSAPWLTNEMMHLFHFFRLSIDMMSAEGRDRSTALIQAVVPGLPAEVPQSLATFASAMGNMEADASNTVSAAVSLRLMLRAARRAAVYPTDFYNIISAGIMLRFMPAAARAAVSSLLEESGVHSPDLAVESMVDISTVDGILHIGEVSVPVAQPQNPELVPDVVFFEIPSHTLVLRSMLKDFQLGEHLLLMGNQGVGKNKLTDHFVKLMQREREYIQLHRDTTVPMLTINPSLEDGQIVWEDSPLVRSMTRGRILVVDEFDKAPVEVVCVLKGLLEDGEILLADGRRFVSAKSVLYDLAVAPTGPDGDKATFLRIHPEFRVIALANRPGYPFLGNDFFAEMGDVFACHAIDNPDQASEISLLRSYAADVPATTIRQLTAALVDLRKLNDDGLLAYPYSTRELVNIVRHMSKFPQDSMHVVLENVFSFDSYDDGLLRMLHDVFRRHGIPIGRHDGVDSQQTESDLAPELFLPEPMLQVAWTDGVEVAAGLPFEDWPIVYEALPAVPNKPSDPFGSAAIGEQQILQLGELTSARSNRFAEEVMGWKMQGITGGYGDRVPMWLTPLPDGSVAAISLSLEIQICDPANERVKIIPLFPAHPMCADPPMAWIPAAERLVVYSKLQNGLYVVNPANGDGQLISLDMPLLQDPNIPKERAAFMRARVQVAMVQDLTNKGGILLHVIGGSDIFVVYVLGNDWHAKRLNLGNVSLQRVQVIFDNKLMVEDTAGQTYSCILHHASNALDDSFFSQLTGATLRTLDAVSHANDQALTLSPAIRTPPLITAAFSDNIASTGWTSAVGGSETVMGGFTSGFSNDPDTGLVSPGVEAGMWTFPKGDTLLVPPDTQHKILRKWMQALQAVVTVVCTPNAVSVHVLDYTRGTFYSVELGPTIGSSSAATEQGSLTQDGKMKWQKWCQVVCVTELADGRMCLLQEDGMVRVFEFSAEALATAEAEWKIMIGTADSASGQYMQQRRSGTEDDTWGDDVDDQEDWEMGVVLRVSDQLLYDVQLYSGEYVEGLSANALDSDDAGPIAAGSTVWVDMQQVKWEDDDDDEEEHDDDDSDRQNQRGRKGKTKGKGNGRGRGKGKGKGRSGSGGSGERHGLMDMDFNLQPGEKAAVGDVILGDGDDAMAQAQLAARESMAKRQKPKELTDRFVSEKDYVDMYDVVAREVATLRVMLEGMEATEKERVWVKNQIQGEFDDNKLVDGALGERNVYKRRGNNQPLFGRVQQHPKRLRFCMDLSGSMRSFNGWDRRLDRAAASAVMIMESFAGLEHKYSYSMYGHSGAAVEVPLVLDGSPPRDREARLDVINRIYEHVSYVKSGDNTLASALAAVQQVTEHPGDDYFVFLLSDAMLEQYNVSPQNLADALLVDPRVNSYCIFIGEEDTAQRMGELMPPGRAHVCMDTAKLPLIFKEIFAHSLSSGAAKM